MLESIVHKIFFKIGVSPKNDSFERKAFEETEGITGLFRGFRKGLAAKDGVLQAYDYFEKGLLNRFGDDLCGGVSSRFNRLTSRLWKKDLQGTHGRNQEICHNRRL